MIYLRQASMLDILAVYNGVCQDERDEITAVGHSNEPSDVAATLWKADVKYALSDETHGAIAIIAGFLEIPGVYRLAMLCKTDAWERAGKEISLLTGHTLAESFKHFKATRFELRCLSRRLLAQRWYVKLGFVKEADLAGYGAEPFSMYVYTGEKT